MLAPLRTIMAHGKPAVMMLPDSKIFDAVNQFVRRIGRMPVSYRKKHLSSLIHTFGPFQDLIKVVLQCTELAPPPGVVRRPTPLGPLPLWTAMGNDFLVAFMLLKEGHGYSYLDVRMFLTYCSTRMHGYLTRGEDTQDTQPITWYALRHIMVYMVSENPQSSLGELYASGGFIMMMEMAVRIDNFDLKQLEFAEAIRAVCVILMRALSRLTPSSWAPCLSLIMTTLKLERWFMLSFSSDKKPLPDIVSSTLIDCMSVLLTCSAPTPSQLPPHELQAASALRELSTAFTRLVMMTLVVLSQMPLSPSAVVRRTGFMQDVVLPRFETFTAEQTAAAANYNGPFHILGCSNAKCMEYNGCTEALMVTHLCSGCRRQRYCSVKCQTEAWQGEWGHVHWCQAHAVVPVAP